MDQTHAVALDIKSASRCNGALDGHFKKSCVNALRFVKAPNTRAYFGAGAKSCPTQKTAAVAFHAYRFTRICAAFGNCTVKYPWVAAQR